MPTIYRRESARRDLVAHFVYLAENVSLSTANQFLEKVEVSFRELAAHPRMGSPLNRALSNLTGIRKWRVRGFDHHLIFYLATDDGISVVRVLHASRDWWSMLSVLD